MTRFLILLLCLLTLTGCSERLVLEEPNVTSAILETTGFAATALYQPGTKTELETGGAVRVYPVPMDQLQGIRTFGDGLLLFSGNDSTTLTILSGEKLTIGTSMDLGCKLDWRDPSLSVNSGIFSFYNSMTQEILVMDETLKIVSRIAAPEDLTGSPIFSEDRNTLFYCTSTAVRAWDLESGIRRTLKVMCYDHQTLTGLHRENGLLQCVITDGGREKTLFLRTEDGQQLASHEGALCFTDRADNYYAAYEENTVKNQVFGSWNGDRVALRMPEHTEDCFFLEDQEAAVTVTGVSDSEIRFDYFDLSTGLRTSSLTLDSSHDPTAVIGSSDGNVFILMDAPAYQGKTIFRWQPEALPVQDTTVYTGPHYTAENPDLWGLEYCQTLAEEIGSKYGITVKIWKDAAALAPWDYDFKAEYLVPVLEQELQLLDQRLAHYPPEILEQTASHFSGLTIGLVRQISGSAQSGSLDAATGIQFLKDTEACVVIAAGTYSEQALYHELFHVMETHILTDSIAFDQWDKLNPSGFSYDYDYLTNASRDSGVYLQSENRAFIDTYSMSYPKEDRARIMEYAMLPGNQELFQSLILQKKLQALCDGIRDAYRLESNLEAYLWEQYLD